MAQLVPLCSILGCLTPRSSCQLGGMSKLEVFWSSLLPRMRELRCEKGRRMDAWPSSDIGPGEVSPLTREWLGQDNQQ